ncbi:Putative ribonuclease H protein [Dendrobium catenatum]|uniref:Ribonuclease H protein n=1 Tax=Dendrobium catenatum TaxID=906689 RepID=A0A2I0VS98_9ASPA|nr:Putative ribonuclease H protein [Dendrobium catenatum]
MLFENIFTVFQKKFMHWPSKFLSFGGRLTLIKSVLNSIPIFIFHTLNPPANVCNKLEILINKFFWGSSYNNSGIRWAKWFKLCGVYEEGALGCKSISDMVKGFSHKLWFNFRSNISLWSQFMLAKYCKGLHPLNAQYKNIDSAVCKIKEVAELNIQWGLGNGDVAFWQDDWLGFASIDRILNTVTLENVKVNAFLVNGEWNTDRLREVIPYEVVALIFKIPLQLHVQDKILFKITANGKFSFKRLWELLRDKEEINHIYKALWHNTIHVSYSLLIWRCLKGYLPVDTRLWNKGFYIVSKC